MVSTEEEDPTSLCSLPVGSYASVYHLAIASFTVSYTSLYPAFVFQREEGNVQLKYLMSGWEVGGTRWWVLERARIAWSTGCSTKTMNTLTLKINLKNLKKST